MKTKQLIALLITLGILGALALVVRSQKESRIGDRGTSTAYRDLVFPNLDVNEVAHVTITKPEGTVHLSRGDSGWTLTERDDYPADFGKLRALIQTLGRLKIAQGMTVPESATGRLGLLDPTRAGAADATTTTTNSAATRVDLLGKEGDTPIASLLIGNTPNSGGSTAGNGKIVKAVSDEGMAWIVSETFSEASSDPKDWISKDFFEVAKLRAVALMAPVVEDSWSAAREKEDGDFLIDDPGVGMESDPSKVSAFKYLLTSPGFQDLLTNEEAAAVDFSKNAYKAKLVTFDGFTYHLEILPESSDAPAAGQGARTTPSYLVKVDVTGTFNEKREPVDGEGEEARKNAEEAFAREIEELKKKLADEQRLRGHIYKVSEYTLSALIKKKSELLKATPQPEPAPEALPAPAPPQPAQEEPLAEKETARAYPSEAEEAEEEAAEEEVAEEEVAEEKAAAENPGGAPVEAAVDDGEAAATSAPKNGKSEEQPPASEAEAESISDE